MNDVTITIRVPKNWKAGIINVAKKEQRSVSSLIRKDMNDKYPELEKLS